MSFDENMRVALEGSLNKKASERLEELTGGNFDKFPRKKSTYQGTLPGIERISLFKSPSEEKSGNVRSLFVVPVYENKKGEERRLTLSLSSDGALAGNIPSDFPVSRETLREETLNILEGMYGKPFTAVDGEILPEGEGEEKGLIEKSGEKIKDNLPDYRRLTYFTNNPDVYFVFGDPEQIDQYRGYVFPDCIVVTKIIPGNAAYIFPTETKLPKDGERHLTEEEREKYLEKNWKKFEGLDKKTVQEMGAMQVVHPKRILDDNQWLAEWEKKIEGKMAEFLNKRQETTQLISDTA